MFSFCWFDSYICWCFSFCLSCRTLLVAWTWVAISIHILKKFSAIISSNIFSCQLLLSSSSVTLMIQMLGPLTLTQKSLRLFTLQKEKNLLLYSSASIYFHILPSCSLICSSGSVTLLLVPSRVFLICYCFAHCWLTIFLSSRSLLTISLHLLNMCLQCVYLYLWFFFSKILDDFHYHYSEFREVQCPIVSFGVSMDLVWFWSTCLLMCMVVFLFCWEICMGCICTGACWLLGGAWF